MLKEIFRVLVPDPKDENYPCCGIFYAIEGRLITDSFCKWAVDPIQGRVMDEYEGYRVEHRDMWDELIVPDYSKTAAACGDDHKALPRGRVELTSMPGECLSAFRVTLCKCLDNDDFRKQVLDAFHLEGRQIEWSVGTMNYLCKKCAGTA